MESTTLLVFLRADSSSFQYGLDFLAVSAAIGHRLIARASVPEHNASKTGMISVFVDEFCRLIWGHCNCWVSKLHSMENEGLDKQK